MSDTSEQTNLFQTGHFFLHSGTFSKWKIECDALTDQDWDTLALIAAEILPSFGSVEGVLSGGLKFAEALRKYQTTGPLLIADDVLTTGESMEKHRNGRDAYGIVVFHRGMSNKDFWVWSIFRMPFYGRRKIE